MAEKGKEDSGSNNGFLIGIGILIGAAAVFVILKSRTPTHTMQQMAPPTINLSPIIKIDQMDLREALMGMGRSPTPAPQLTGATLSNYSNHNDYEVERDASGKIKHVRQIRDAKITGG